MSGICGQFNINDEALAQSQLATMAAMLRQRGPDGLGIWQNGPIGLGHALLATTRELVFEKQPFRHLETACTITADVRLDNRRDLRASLSLDVRGKFIGDAELILQSYLKWGDECLAHLRGDFAFALFDPRHHRMFCARDHFGMRPFYYHHAPHERFVFASDTRAILVQSQVPYQLSHGRIADFLVPELEWIDYTSTFFEHVFRLPPGHFATVTRSGLQVVEYWKPEPGPDLPRMSDNAYAEGFLEVFTKAVTARLSSPNRTTGAMLSGGLDSGSVVAVGKEVLKARGDAPLPTFSGARRQGLDCAESRAIYAAASMTNIDPSIVDPEALAGNFKSLVTGHEEPYDGEFVILKAIYSAARARGLRVVLDGGGGDIVLSEGSYIARLISQGQFRHAMREIAAEQYYWNNGSTLSTGLRYLRGALVPDAVKKAVRKIRHRHRVNDSIAESLISRDFADSADIVQRFKQLGQMFPANQPANLTIERVEAIRPNIHAGRERYARLAASSAIEACDPFLDQAVVDYCSRLPERLLMKNGWPKHVLRDLMADHLPREVRWSRRKPHLGWLYNDVVSREAYRQGDLNISQLHKTLADYVDPTALDIAWRDFTQRSDPEPIHTAHILSIWLGESATRPIAPD